jgi:hypothetical protein
VFTATLVDGKSRGQGSTKAFDSVYTVMNEHNQIVSIHFVRSGDMKEVQVILERVQRRYKLHGFVQIELFYTDNCCQEYKMLTSAFPSLAKNDARTSNTRKELERLKPPASNQGDIIVWRHARIRLGTEYELAYLTTKQSDSAQEDRSAQRNQEPEANETTNRILGPITLDGDRRFVVNVEDDDVAPFLPEHSTINDYPEAHEIDNDVNPNDLGSHDVVIVSHDADGAVSVDETAIAAPCGCPGRSWLSGQELVVRAGANRG